MGWLKRLNNSLIRVNASFSFGVDASGKQIVIGLKSNLPLDTNFGNGSVSAYGKGSIALDPAGGIHIVDADGYWQTPTITAASPSASPSASVSPSSSPSPSVSSSASRSVSPSASQSPSASASPS